MYNKNMNKGKICTVKDMDRSNKRRNHCQKQVMINIKTKLIQIFKTFSG